MKICLYLDREYGLTLYMVNSKGEKTYCDTREDFFDFINYVTSIDFNIVKDGRDLILKCPEKGINFKIVDYNRVFKYKDTIGLKRTIDRVYAKKGAINRTHGQHLSRKKTHSSKHSKDILKKVTCLAVSGAIAVGGISLWASTARNKPLTPSEYISQTYQTESALNVDDLGTGLDFERTDIDYEEDIDATHDPGNSDIDTEEELSEVVPDINENITLESENNIEFVDVNNTATLDFENLSATEKAITCKKLYYDLFQKIAPKYGIDPNLMLAIATQERGVHSDVIDAGGGLGLMQIQYGVWAGQRLNYYELGDDGSFHEDSVIVMDDLMRQLENNIETACRIFQGCLVCTAYNIPMSIQMYNQGYGSIHDLLVNYCAEKGLDRGELCHTPSDLGWYSRTDGYDGDPEYLENVLKWSENPTFTCINVETKEPVTFTFHSYQNVR